MVAVASASEHDDHGRRVVGHGTGSSNHFGQPVRRVGIVDDDGEATVNARGPGHYFEASRNGPESLETTDDVVERDTEFSCRDNGGQRVGDVERSANSDMNPTSTPLIAQ